MAPSAPRRVLTAGTEARGIAIDGAHGLRIPAAPYNAPADHERLADRFAASP